MLHLPPTFLHRQTQTVRTSSLGVIPGAGAEAEAGVDKVVAAAEASQATEFTTLPTGHATRSTLRQGAHRHPADFNTPAIVSRTMAKCA